MTSSKDTRTGPAPAPPERMTKAEFQRLYDRLRAQPPWGPADRRGALNYLTPATVLAAAGAVKLGAPAVAAFLGQVGAARGRDPAHHLGRGGVPGGRRGSPTSPGRAHASAPRRRPRTRRALPTPAPRSGAPRGGTRRRRRR